MPQASNLQKLASRPAEKTRRGVADFIEANANVIGAAKARGHSWTTIFEDAVKDGCPTISLRYFRRAARAILGLQAAHGWAPLSGKARRVAAENGQRHVPNGEQVRSFGRANVVADQEPGPTDHSLPIEQPKSAVEPSLLAHAKDRDERDPVGSLYRGSPSGSMPTQPGASRAGVAASGGVAGGIDAPFAPARQLPQPPKSEAERAWDNAAPGKRAMLLKDAE